MPRDFTIDCEAVRGLLAERLAADTAGVDADALLAAASATGKPGALRARVPLADPRLHALALMLVMARAGDPARALTLSAQAIERRPGPVLHRFVEDLERAARAAEPAGPLLDGDGNAIVFVVSFPRSGSTRFLNIMAGAFPGSRFTAFLSEGRYVSPWGAGCAAKGPVFVKDHALKDAYRHNRVLYLVRDGRDCMLSFNDFRLRRAAGGGAEAGADTLAAVVEGGDAGPPFGGWPAEVNKALQWRAAGCDIALLPYDALVGPQGFEVTAAALAGAGITLTAERYEAGLANAAQKETALRANGAGWGRERIYPAGSLMDRWLDASGASKWQALLRPQDKAMLHNAGFTGPLMRAGFEKDENWWHT
ncbi:MAG: hypothetical protein AcusKO_31560 [Acuticoccus sp.]